MTPRGEKWRLVECCGLKWQGIKKKKKKLAPALDVARDTHVLWCKVGVEFLLGFKAPLLWYFSWFLLFSTTSYIMIKGLKKSLRLCFLCSFLRSTYAAGLPLLARQFDFSSAITASTFFLALSLLAAWHPQILSSSCRSQRAHWYFTCALMTSSRNHEPNSVTNSLLQLEFRSLGVGREAVLFLIINSKCLLVSLNLFFLSSPRASF